MINKLFKTVKYCPAYPTSPFESLEKARDWVISFVHWYNNHHLHSGIKFVTPMSRHNLKDQEILDKRKKVYELAKQKKPERWSGKTRNWDRIEKVELNNVIKEKNLDSLLAS